MRFRPWILILFLGIILYTCASQNSSNAKKNFLVPEKMSAILADIYLLEGAYTQNQGLIFDTLEASANYQAIYQKHQVKYEEVKSSYRHYETHPEELAKIYEAVIDSLNQKQLYINLKVKDTIRQSKP